MLSLRVKAFWARVRQGLTILNDRERFAREVLAVQFAGWLPPLHRLLVPARGVQRRRLGEERAARARRSGGGGRGPVHARRRGRAAGAAREGVRRHGGRARPSPPTRSASRSRSRRSRSRVGFVALVFIFRIRSFKEVIARGREERDAERGAKARGLGPEALARLAHERDGLGEDARHRLRAARRPAARRSPGGSAG